METILIIAAAVLWGCGTSLLISRPAYRLSVPPEEAWRSACPAGHPFTGTGGGWLGRARCAAGDTYGPNVLSVASATALVCALLAAVTGARPELVVWLLLAPAAVLLATVDFAAHRLPDVLTLPLAAAALALLGVAAALPGAGGRWTSALLGSLILGACYFVLFLISKGFGFETRRRPGRCPGLVRLGDRPGRDLRRVPVRRAVRDRPDARGPGRPYKQDPVRPVSARRDAGRRAPRLLLILILGECPGEPPRDRPHGRTRLYPDTLTNVGPWPPRRVWCAQ